MLPVHWHVLEETLASQQLRLEHVALPTHLLALLLPALKPSRPIHLSVCLLLHGHVGRVLVGREGDGGEEVERVFAHGLLQLGEGSEGGGEPEVALDALDDVIHEHHRRELGELKLLEAIVVHLLQTHPLAAAHADQSSLLLLILHAPSCQAQQNSQHD
eukprot:767057-Hanusia_phi.AAC.3